MAEFRRPSLDLFRIGLIAFLLTLILSSLLVPGVDFTRPFAFNPDSARHVFNEQAFMYALAACLALFFAYVIVRQSWAKPVRNVLGVFWHYAKEGGRLFKRNLPLVGIVLIALSLAMAGTVCNELASLSKWGGRLGSGTRPFGWHPLGLQSMLSAIAFGFITSWWWNFRLLTLSVLAIILAGVWLRSRRSPGSSPLPLTFKIAATVLFCLCAVEVAATVAGLCRGQGWFALVWPLQSNYFGMRKPDLGVFGPPMLWLGNLSGLFFSCMFSVVSVLLFLSFVTEREESGWNRFVKSFRGPFVPLLYLTLVVSGIGLLGPLTLQPVYAFLDGHDYRVVIKTLWTVLYYLTLLVPFALAFFPLAVFLEGRGFRSALRRSLELVRRNWLALVLIAVTLWLIRYPAGLLFRNIPVFFHVDSLAGVFSGRVVFALIRFFQLWIALAFFTWARDVLARYRSPEEVPSAGETLEPARPDIGPVQ